MHQQPLLAPHLPNRFSSAGHRSGVTGRIVSFMPLSLLYRALLYRAALFSTLDLGGASVGTRRGLSQVWPGDFVSAKGREHLGLSSCTNVHSTTRCTQLAWLLCSQSVASLSWWRLNASARLPGRKLPREEQMPPFGPNSRS